MQENMAAPAETSETTTEETADDQEEGLESKNDAFQAHSDEN